MNGVRRFLGGGGKQAQPPPSPVTSSPPSSIAEPPLPPLPPLQTTAPLVISKPSWPPTPLTAGQGAPAPVMKQEQGQNRLRDSSSSNNAQHVNNKRSSDDTVSSPSHSRPHSAHSSPSRKPVPMSPTSVGSPTSISGRVPNAIPGPSSPPARPLPNRVAQLSHKTVTALDPTWKRSSNMVDTRDDLLMSLLASEAIVDSHECEVLSSEDVEELKKEHHVLESRIDAMNKKLTLEKKIRDAAVSLAKVNASHKSVSKQSTEQLEAANRKVETVQKELWRLSERSNEIMKKLLEHRAGVLSISLKNLEAKVTGNETDDSGYGTSSFRSAQMSPTSSEMSHATSSFRGRFEGPHLFAGHADAVPPMSPKRKKPAAASELAALEQKLKEVTDKLKEANEAQQTAKRELSHMQLEKAEIETTMSLELQSAEDTIASLEEQLKGMLQLEERIEELEREREEWEAQRLASREEVEALERRLEVMEEKSGENVALQTRITETESALERLREIMMAHGVVHNPREGPSFRDHLDSLETHLENLEVGAQDAAQSDRDAVVQAQAVAGMQAELERRLAEERRAREEERREREDERRRWEEEKRGWEEQRLSMQSEAQALVREREDARKEVKMLEMRAKQSTPSTISTPPSPTVTLKADINYANASPDLQKFMAVLYPVWVALPSAETRASKFGVRKGSPTTAPGSPQTSLSELDVRLLKNLYDGKPAYHQLENGAGGAAVAAAIANGATNGSVPGSGSGLPTNFSAESFAQRVQALIADDKALIERLIRFAQAHDLLKKNAERAQKLAQDSSVALETYQRQVKALEERNRSLTGHHAAMQDEVRELQEAIDRITAEKREVETQAAAQAETCKQLTEANATLSAKALSLAEEAAAAPEAVRRQLEQQLAVCQAALTKAEEEVNAMRTSEQTQQMALLDELNSVQTENEALRAQLRAAGKR